MMAMGGALGLTGLDLPAVETAIAMSALVLGASILFEARPALPIALGIVGFFAVFHGHAHATQLHEPASALTYGIGFVMATGLLHALGIAIGMIHGGPQGRQAMRIAGALVAVGGTVFFVRALA
jgi:urease accessory protein